MEYAYGTYDEPECPRKTKNVSYITLSFRGIPILSYTARDWVQLGSTLILAAIPNASIDVALLSGLSLITPVTSRSPRSESRMSFVPSLELLPLSVDVYLNGTSTRARSLEAAPVSQDAWHRENTKIYHLDLGAQHTTLRYPTEGWLWPGGPETWIRTLQELYGSPGAEVSSQHLYSNDLSHFFSYVKIVIVELSSCSEFRERCSPSSLA